MDMKHEDGHTTINLNGTEGFIAAFIFGAGVAVLFVMLLDLIN